MLNYRRQHWNWTGQWRLSCGHVLHVTTAALLIGSFWQYLGPQGLHHVEPMSGCETSIVLVYYCVWKHCIATLCLGSFIVHAAFMLPENACGPEYWLQYCVVRCRLCFRWFTLRYAPSYGWKIRMIFPWLEHNI